jgi:hypothetical protein
MENVGVVIVNAVTSRINIIYAEDITTVKMKIKTLADFTSVVWQIHTNLSVQLAASTLRLKQQT